MEIHSYQDMAEMEKGNWWYVSRRALLLKILSRYVPVQVNCALDLGCGVGSHFTILQAYAEQIDGVDLSHNALDFAKKYTYRNLLQSRAEKLPAQEESYDLILCADVIEHVEDRQAMREIFRALKPGGIALITTPAFPSLWHENDDYSHHLRRYSKAELIQLAIESGFCIKYLRYWNHLFFPIVWCVARFYRKPMNAPLSNNLAQIPAWANTLLILWMSFERFMSSMVSVPFGTSLVLVIQKQKGGT